MRDFERRRSLLGVGDCSADSNRWSLGDVIIDASSSLARGDRSPSLMRSTGAVEMDSRDSAASPGRRCGDCRNMRAPGANCSAVSQAGAIHAPAAGGCCARHSGTAHRCRPDVYHGFFVHGISGDLVDVVHDGEADVSGTVRQLHVLQFDGHVSTRHDCVARVHVVQHRARPGLSVHMGWINDIRDVHRVVQRHGVTGNGDVAEQRPAVDFSVRPRRSIDRLHRQCRG